MTRCVLLYFRLRVLCWAAGGAVVLGSIFVNRWLLLGILPALIFERRLAARERGSWELLAAILLSLEVIMQDFAGWGKAYPEARQRAVKLLLGSEESKLKPTWFDFYLPYPARMEANFLREFAPSGQASAQSQRGVDPDEGDSEEKDHETEDTEPKQEDPQDASLDALLAKVFPEDTEPKQEDSQGTVDAGAYSAIAEGRLKHSGLIPAQSRRGSPTSGVKALWHFALGYIMGKLNRPSEAIAEFRTAIRLGPDSGRAHYNLGVALHQEGDRDGEIAEYRKAIRLEPDLFVAHHDLSNALRQRGDLDGAVSASKTAIRLRPDSPKCHLGLGLALLGKEGKLDAAITQFRIVIQLDSNDATAHACLGLALAKKGDLQAGLRELKKACELDPTNSQYRSSYEDIQSLLNRR